MDSADTVFTFAVEPVSAAGSTGTTNGSASAVVSPVASSRPHSRAARAASHPSIATAPAASR
jgi:hypothetical protein